MKDRVDLCARCRETVSRNRGVTWPEGFVCRRCYQQATERRGSCPACGTDRLLPGLSPTDEPICADCAGLSTDFHCRRCQREAAPFRFGLCAPCVLRDDLGVVLDDGTGRVRPELVPLFDALRDQPNPVSAILWIGKPAVHELLHRLAVGDLPITRETFSDHHRPKLAQHIQDLLIRHGVLPPMHRDLVAFEDWLTTHLPRYPPVARQLLQGFATWHHLRRMRSLADRRRLTRITVYNAEQQITVGGQFLAFLDDRTVRYQQLRQEDVDAWLSAGPTTRYTARTFVLWAGRTRRLPPVRFPCYRSPTHPVLDQRQRLELLDGLFRESTNPLTARIVGILLLLYAQPVTRIVRLPLNSVADTDRRMTITFKDHPAEIPEPVADLIRRHLRHRPNMNTATNPSSPWLFPGYRAGQPLTPNRAMIQLRGTGIPLKAARNSALRQLVLDMPAAVAAQALGYSPITTERHAAQSGTVWSSYPARRRATERSSDRS